MRVLLRFDDDDDVDDELDYDEEMVGEEEEEEEIIHEENESPVLSLSSSSSSLSPVRPPPPCDDVDDESPKPETPTLLAPPSRSRPRKRGRRGGRKHKRRSVSPVVRSRSPPRQPKSTVVVVPPPSLSPKRYVIPKVTRSDSRSSVESTTVNMVTTTRNPRDPRTVSPLAIRTYPDRWRQSYMPTNHSQVVTSGSKFLYKGRYELLCACRCTDCLERYGMLKMDCLKCMVFKNDFSQKRKKCEHETRCSAKPVKVLGYDRPNVCMHCDDGDEITFKHFINGDFEKNEIRYRKTIKRTRWEIDEQIREHTVAIFELLSRAKHDGICIFQCEQHKKDMCMTCLSVKCKVHDESMCTKCRGGPGYYYSFKQRRDGEVCARANIFF